MEPINATVHVKPDACEIWTGTQIMTRVQSEAAKAAGLPVEKVIVNQHLLGGGFGRKLEPDMVVAAVKIAKQVDGPVKVIWTREEDIQHDVYRPVYRDQINATLVDGKVAAWKYKIAGSAMIARWLPPAFQKGVDIDAVDAAVDDALRLSQLPRRICPCRAAGCADRLLARCRPEQQRVRGRMRAGRTGAQGRQGSGRIPPVDAGQDSALRSRCSISPRRNPAGANRCRPRVGRGVCLQPSFASFIATVVEAEIDDIGEITLRRITSVVDTGIAVNPDTIEAQIEGGLIFGLTAALYGEITIDKGRVQQSNFHDYRMMRINETPKIEVIVVKSGEAPGGIGEAGVNCRTAGAAQRDLRRNRRGAAAPADRPETSGCGEEGMSGKMRILTSLVVIAIVVAALGVWIIRGPGPLDFAGGTKVALADYRAGKPTGVPAKLEKASVVERGEYLAKAADCMVCHTKPGEKEYSGGLGFKLPFGTLYSTNITPDKDTGIGNYSDQDFLNAVQRGTRHDGARLYPAMPYTSYTYMTDEDVLAVKAYLFSLPAVRAKRPTTRCRSRSTSAGR